MLNRKQEAADALKFAEDMDAIYAKKGAEGRPLLEQLKQVRAEKKLAVIPTAALGCRQLYADLLAEHMARKYAGEKSAAFPNDEEIAALGETQAKDFRAFFAGEDTAPDFQQYGRGVYDTHMATRKFFAAAAAYAQLRPGKKGEPDAEPEEQALREAMEKKDAEPMKLTFDVYSNMISPMDRYARALSRLAPEGKLIESAPLEKLRIPKALLAEGKADEIALAVLLYYKHRPEKVQGWTDFYPVPQSETGVYISEYNQVEAVGKLFRRSGAAGSGKAAPLPIEEEKTFDLPAEEFAEEVDEEFVEESAEDKAPEPGAEKKPTKAGKLRWMRMHEVHIPGASVHNRRLMVSLKQECVDAFVNCWRENADPNDYLEADDNAPRAVFDAVRAQIEGGRSAEEGLREYMTTEFTDDELKAWVLSCGEAVLKKLKETMEANCDQADFKGEKGKPTVMFKNASHYWVLKLCCAAHWVEKYQQNSKEYKGLSETDLTAMLEGDAVEVFSILEKAKRRAFGCGLTRMKDALSGEDALNEALALAENMGLSEFTDILAGEGEDEARLDAARRLAGAGSRLRMKFDRVVGPKGEFEFSYRIYKDKNAV